MARCASATDASSPSARARISSARLPQDTEIVDAGGRIVLPGFVDAHTHPVFAGNRAGEFERRVEGATYAEIAAAGGGIRSTVRRTREASGDALLAAGRRYADWFLRGGTTTIEAKSGYGLSLDAEIKILKTIRQLNADAPPALCADFPGRPRSPRRIPRPDRRLCRSRDPRDAAARRRREPRRVSATSSANPTCFPWNRRAPYCAPRRRSASACACMPTSSAPITARCSPPNSMPPRPTIWSPPPPPGWPRLHAAGVQPVLLPASVYNLGSTRYPAARRMIDLGLPVVLATDFNPGSSPTASMPMVLSLAATQMKMTPAESITAATINAAHSLRRGHRDRLARTRQGRRFRHPRLRRLSRAPLFLRPRTGARRLLGGDVRLPAQRLKLLRNAGVRCTSFILVTR